MSMTILPENVLMIPQAEIPIFDTEDSLLRMTDDEHTYAPDHTNGEDFDIALNM